MQERLGELAAIYADYQNWLLRGDDWADAEGQGWLAAIALDERPTLCRDVRLLVVDGFDEFNPTQLGVLKTLAQRAGETLITLTGDVARERPMLRRLVRAREVITHSLNVAPTPLSTLHSPLSTFRHLETWLFDPAPRKRPADGAIELIEAQNRREEVRAALRWIKARAVRDHIALHEMALVARDMGPYREFIQETADEFGLPVRLAGGLPLARNPAIAALMALLALPADDSAWPRRRVIEAWRSPYFDWSGCGIHTGEADALDTLSRRGRVIRGLAQWREAFAFAGAPAERDQDEPEPPLTPEQAAELEIKFKAFAARVTPLAQATVRDHVAFIESLIGDEPSDDHAFHRTEDAGLSVVLRARENPATRERDVAALRAFKDVLRGLVLADSVFGKTADEKSFAAFLSDLSSAVKAASYEIPLPDAEREVLPVMPALRVRGLAFRAVAVLGLAEGDFPQSERQDVLLTESDRDWLRERGLPIEPRLRGDEATFLYETVTRASERLALCRPYLADDGQAWEPSPYWEHVRQIVDAPMRHIRPDDPTDAPASPQEAASNPTGFHGAALLRARLAEPAGGPFEGDLSSLATNLNARFHADFVWSASRLEAYGACPMDFFTGVALGLEPRESIEEGYNVRAFGSMVHAILERVYQRADDPAKVDAVLAALPDAAREVFDSAPRDYGFRPTRLWQHQRAEIEQTIRKTIAALADEAPAYAPRFYEQAFGFKGQPILDADGVKLHGFIDRVDAAPDGRLRVMDYKTGSTPIAARDLAEGRRLQLPLYALAAREALGLGQVDAGFYWHVGSAKPSSLKLESFEGGLEAAIRLAIAHTRRYVDAIRAGRFEPRVPPGGCPAYCPATAWCWRFEARRA
jgi:ATP-dependent helicase/DNAse subunit B